MKLYLVNNGLFHLCTTEQYNNYYRRSRSSDSLYCYRCNFKFPSILALGSEINTYQVYTKGYFNRNFANATYIDLSLL